MCLPMASAFPAKISRDFDNARPRDPAFWSSGFRARAHGSMANGFEAFPAFAAAVLVGLTQGGDPALVDALSIGFVVARIGFVAAYWADRATLRSILWSIGFGLTVALLLTPLWAPASAT